MLQKLNERIQGVVAWLVIVLVAITFTLFGVDYYLQSHQTTNAKVVVNDKPLSKQAFEVNYRRARGQQDLATMTAADDKNIQKQVLDQMISNEVSVQSAQKYGFGVSTNQANSAILQIPQFQEDGHFSAEKYQQALGNALFTPETFQNEVKQGMLLNQQRFAFMGTSFALPSEMNRYVKLYMQTRDYDYLTVSAAQLEKQIVVDEKVVNEYYQAHAKEFMSPAQVSIDYVVLSMNAIKAKIKVSDEDVKHYYDENQNNYLTPAQWQVSHLLFAVPENVSKEELDAIQSKADAAYEKLQKDPTQFEQLVASSDDKLSIADKGVLPWMTAGQNDYDKTLSTMTKVGQISEPQRTKHGFEIFKLIAYKPVITKSFEQVKSTIQEQLSSDMAQAKYAQTLEQLSDLSYQTPDSLVPVEDTIKLTIQHSSLFSKAGGADLITKNKDVIKAAFSHDVLTSGNNSEPIQIDNDGVVVLRVNEHVPTKEQSLEAVKPQIKKILVQQMANTKAKEIGSELIGLTADKQQQLLKTYKLNWNLVTQASRDNDKVNAQINELAFNVARSGSSEGLSLENGDYVVVKLKNINDGQLKNLDKEQTDSLVQQIESSYGMMDYDLYVNYLISQAKVTDQ